MMTLAVFLFVMAENNLVTSFFFIFTSSLCCEPFHGDDKFKIILSSLEAFLADETGTGRKFKSQCKGGIQKMIHAVFNILF